jgi:hypothetical protein
VWQELRTLVHPKGVEIVTVALDTGGADAARPWIEAANPEHPSLIDTAHVLDARLGVVNVPNAVWIDGDGMIVRPAEPAWPGRTPVIDDMDGLPVPPAYAAVLDEIKKMNIDPEGYLTMLLDWVDKGDESRFALTPDQVVARSRPRSTGLARAAAHFELGVHLHRGGDHDSAIGHWREAHRLDPDNWTYKRQAWNLETGGSVVQAPVYEGNWLSDVEAIGAENYYPPLEP